MLARWVFAGRETASVSQSGKGVVLIIDEEFRFTESQKTEGVCGQDGEPEFSRVDWNLVAIPDQAGIPLPFRVIIASEPVADGLFGKNNMCAPGDQRAGSVPQSPWSSRCVFR